MYHTTNFVPLPLVPTKTSQNEHNDSSKALKNRAKRKLLPSAKTLSTQDDINDDNNYDDVLSEEELPSLVKSIMEG